MKLKYYLNIKLQTIKYSIVNTNTSLKFHFLWLDFIWNSLLHFMHNMVLVELYNYKVCIHISSFRVVAMILWNTYITNILLYNNYTTITSFACLICYFTCSKMWPNNNSPGFANLFVYFDYILVFLLSYSGLCVARLCNDGIFHYTPSIPQACSNSLSHIGNYGWWAIETRHNCLTDSCRVLQRFRYISVFCKYIEI